MLGYQILQQGLNQLADIFTKNKNILFRYPYAIHSDTLARESSICDVGKLLDDKLDLDTHVNKIVKNTYRMYGYVVRSPTEF